MILNNRNSKMIYKIFRNIIFISFIAVIFIACEDPAPTDYTPDIVVEGLLIVDEPIRNITVIRTQPLADSFSYDKSLISNAIVKIKTEGKEFLLDYNPPGNDKKPGYYYSDESYVVKSNQLYELEVIVDGKVMNGTTFTPARTEWVRAPKTFIQYPIDSLKLPPTDSIEWRKAEKADFYLISISCLDSSGYGEYLNPPTNEKNRRIERPFRNDRAYRELTSFVPIPAARDTSSTSTPIVWSVFKFFGKHQVSIYVPDFNFLRWFAQAQARGQVEPILQSINNGFGYFGSASIIRDTSILLKNQP